MTNQNRMEQQQTVYAKKVSWVRKFSTNAELINILDIQNHPMNMVLSITTRELATLFWKDSKAKQSYFDKKREEKSF